MTEEVATTIEEVDEMVMELAVRVERTEGAIRGLTDRLVKAEVIAPLGSNRHARRARDTKQRNKRKAERRAER